MSIAISQFIPLPTSPLGIHKFALYICISISALQIESRKMVQMSCDLKHEISQPWMPPEEVHSSQKETEENLREAFVTGA